MHEALGELQPRCLPSGLERHLGRSRDQQGDQTEVPEKTQSSRWVAVGELSGHGETLDFKCMETDTWCLHRPKTAMS